MIRGRHSSRLAGLPIIAALVAMLTLFTGETAHAEPVVVVSSSPADGEVVAISPPAVIIAFNQNIIVPTAIITCNGSTVDQPNARVGDDLSSLIVDLAGTPLPAGQCEVVWGVQGVTEVGTQRGSLSFSVEQDVASAATDPAGVVAAPAADTSSEVTDPPNVGGPLGLARLFSMLAIGVLFGSIVLITVAWPEGVEYILTIRFIRTTWVVGVVSTAFMLVCLTAQATGESIGSSLNPTEWIDLKETIPGLAALARMGLIVAAGWVAIRPERSIDPTTQLFALAIPGLAVATMGFSREGGDLALVGYAAGVGHALAMAVWMGGLVLLARVVLAGPGEDDLVHAVRGFSKLATPAIVVTVLTGAVQVYRLDKNHLLDSTHGRLLLAKMIPVVAMVFVGVATRQFVRARLAREDVMTAPMAGRLRRGLGMEAVIGVAVLVLTSWMLSTQPANLRASARSSDDFASQQMFEDPDGLMRLKMSVNPAEVGLNEFFIEVFEPESGISTITVQLDPPLGSGVGPVLVRIDNLPGVGGAYAPQAEGLPLAAAGAWNVTVEVVSAAGTFRQAGFLNVTDEAENEITTLTTVPSPIVTSPPTTTTTEPAAAG